MKALSIRQPWAWLIVNGHKDIENRTWRTKFRGQVLIHASQHKVTRDEYESVRAVIIDYENRGCKPFFFPHFESFQHSCMRGGIVGVATITDCVDSSDSPWFFGPKGFVLAAAQRLPWEPMKGRLSFFETGCWLENGELRGELDPDPDEEHP
ncbi:ASCH domain-containing protein [Rahnella inusitata]|uniref:ASCH domain-containing protein n=1 Tax=Rahnella inusitata TaxID=58169 RepID=UPI0039BEAA4F